MEQAIAVPARARDWIIDVLTKKNSNGNIHCNHRIKSLQEINDLRFLTVVDLKALWRELKSIASSHNNNDSGISHVVAAPKPPGNPKKIVWLESIQKLFYMDSSLTLENTSFLLVLQTATSPSPSTTAEITTSCSAGPSATKSPGDNQNRNMKNNNAFPSSSQPTYHPGPYNRNNYLTNSYGPPATHHHHMMAGPYHGHQPPQLPPNGTTPFVQMNNRNTYLQSFPQPHHHQRQHAAAKRPSPKKKSPSPRTKFKTPSPKPKIKTEREQHAKQNNGQSSLSSSSVDYDIQPCTPLEHTSLQCLRQMGFQNVREMLGGIRHTIETNLGNGSSSSSNNDATLIAEMSMMWIVAQREEMEEARKMDQARLSSEQYEKEQAHKLKLSWEQQLSKATSFQTLQQLFPKSTILHETKSKWNMNITVKGIDNDDTDKDNTEHKGDGNNYKNKSTEEQTVSLSSSTTNNKCWIDYSKIKCHIIRLLLLEQKAQKWYGLCVPWRYFVQLSKQLVVGPPSPSSSSSNNRNNNNQDPQDNSDINKNTKEVKTDDITGATSTETEQQQWIADRIRQEAIKLEHIMYALGEQQGGVPRLFLQARTEAKEKGLPIDPEQSLLMTSSSATVTAPSNETKKQKSNKEKGERNEDGDDDDEVVVLLDSFDANENRGNNGGTASSKLQPRSVTPGKSEKAVVIEIS